MLEWFPRAVGFVVIFFWASQSAANSLGLAPPERWPKRYFGQNAQISDTGELRFDWFDPFSNEPKVVSFQQMDVGDVPDKVRQIVSGRSVTCISTLESAFLSHADCYVFLNEVKAGATSILRLISAFRGDLIGCSPSESKALKSVGIQSCG